MIAVNTKPKRTCSLLFNHVPIDTKAQFKAWCAKRGVSMKQQILHMMKEAIRTDAAINPRTRRKHAV